MKEVFETYLQDVQYKDWDFIIGVDGDRNFLQVGFWEQDNMSVDKTTAPREYQKGRKWLLSPYMTKSEVVQTAFKAVLTAEEHESREKFTYRGKCVFGPHFSVDALHDVCQAGKIDIRKELVK